MAIFKVVKYESDPSVFAWKFPSEELGTWTQLIVNESQEAVLFKGGQALDVFQSGRHTLDTKNIPILKNLINLPFGKRSPFTAEVWYVNKVHSLDIKWGTPTPIQIQDPKFGILVPVRSFGQFGVKINDGKKFLVKLVGTLTSFDTENLTEYFRGFYVTKVKDCLSSYIIKKQIPVSEINAYINEISTHMKELMTPIFNEYGINLINFSIKDISIPEDDPSVKTLTDALAKKAEMDIVGYNYGQERSFDTLESAVTNMGEGGGGSSIISDMVGASMGIGMGAAIGGNMASQFGGIVKEINTGTNSQQVTSSTKQPLVCYNCSSVIDDNKRFCAECGVDLSLNPDDITCSNCNARSLKDKKFCADCGMSLVNTCSKCESVIEGTPKFCPECGEKQN